MPLLNHLVLFVSNLLVLIHWFTPKMSDDALIRRTNLKSLGLGPKDLQEKIGKSYQYWRDLMETEKSFGERAARNIEEKLDIPRGWLDSARTHTSSIRAYPNEKAPQAPLNNAQAAN